MKKVLPVILMAFMLVGCAIPANNFDILTLFSSESNSENKLWVGTFQLVFNDMKNNILKKEVEFLGEKQTKDLKGLNKEEFNSSMLNSESYYTSFGETSPEAKEKIKKDIKEKFNETSDVLDKLDWKKGVGKYYTYAMLKKHFEFLKDFDKLDIAPFNNSKEKYKYFGIKNSSSTDLYDNIKVLFYNSDNDFALQLLTKNDDIVYLYRTESSESFEKIYSKMLKNTKNYKGSNRFNKNDTFKAPNLKFKKQKNYEELCNKIIKGTDFMFSDAIETIEMELDFKGGKVKSEAVAIMFQSSIQIEKPVSRHFDFDKTFVMFLIDKGKTDPYLALRIKDLSAFTK